VVPTVLWFTGLSGAGKTTLALGVATALRTRGQAALILDGDLLRAGLSSDLGFSPADRREQVRRVAEVAALAAADGIIAVVALVSPCAADRAWARACIGSGFREIYLSTPLAVCAARDPKGLYAQAHRGELTGLTGIDATYDVPHDPDLILDTSQVEVATAVARVLGLLAGPQPG
jgi:adenylylsulfate kinase